MHTNYTQNCVYSDDGRNRLLFTHAEFTLLLCGTLYYAVQDASFRHLILWIKNFKSAATQINL